MLHHVTVGDVANVRLVVLYAVHGFVTWSIVFSVFLAGNCISAVLLRP
jgi:hypothetical protein